MSEAVDTAGWAIQVPIGYRVGGWEVVRPIATGSWASVYEGRRVDGEGGATAGLPDRAALKFLPTGTLTPRQLGHLAEMAARELRAHRKLRHPRLIGFHHTLVVDDPGHPELDGAAVIVMERAAASLADALARAAGGPVPDAARIHRRDLRGPRLPARQGLDPRRPEAEQRARDGRRLGTARRLRPRRRARRHPRLPAARRLPRLHGPRALGRAAHRARHPLPHRVRRLGPRRHRVPAAERAHAVPRRLPARPRRPGRTGTPRATTSCCSPRPCRRAGASGSPTASPPTPRAAPARPSCSHRARRLAADPARARVRRRPRRRREALGRSLAMALGTRWRGRSRPAAAAAGRSPPARRLRRPRRSTAMRSSPRRTAGTRSRR